MIICYGVAAKVVNAYGEDSDFGSESPNTHWAYIIGINGRGGGGGRQK